MASKSVIKRISAQTDVMPVASHRWIATKYKGITYLVKMSSLLDAYIKEKDDGHDE